MAVKFEIVCDEMEIRPDNDSIVHGRQEMEEILTLSVFNQIVLVVMQILPKI